MKSSIVSEIESVDIPPAAFKWPPPWKYLRANSFTEKETEEITKELSVAGRTFQKINASMLIKFLNLQNSFTGAIVGAGLKTYNNVSVRQGKPITNPKAHAMGYVKHVEMKLQEMIDKSKSPKGKDKYRNLQKEYKREVMKHVGNLAQIVTFQNAIVNAKMLIVKKNNYKNWT